MTLNSNEFAVLMDCASADEPPDEYYAEIERAELLADEDLDNLLYNIDQYHERATAHLDDLRRLDIPDGLSIDEATTGFRNILIRLFFVIDCINYDMRH